jgi:hypothetical protein
MSYGIVDLAHADEPIVMLDRAHLCEDCNGISAAPQGCCLKCGSRSLLSIANALNYREEQAPQMIHGEPVVLPAGAVMGAEMIAPGQRNLEAPNAVL